MTDTVYVSIKIQTVIKDGFSNIVIKGWGEDFLFLYIWIGPPNYVTCHTLYGVHILSTNVYHMSIFYHKPVIEVSVWLQVNEWGPCTLLLQFSKAGHHQTSCANWQHANRRNGLPEPQYAIFWDGWKLLYSLSTWKPCQCRGNSPAMPFYRSC